MYSLEDNTLYDKKADDFFPIVAHYDYNTLITRDGHLVQIIKINGLNTQHFSTDLLNIRQTLRSSIHKWLDKANIAWWFHTISSTSKLTDYEKSGSDLYLDVNRYWVDRHNWQDNFTKDLYISVVCAGTKSRNSFMAGLRIALSHDLSAYQRQLQENHKQLSTLVDKVMQDLAAVNPYRLQIAVQEQVYYSELLSFYHYLTSLEAKRYELPNMDLAQSLAGQQYAVGNDMIELVSDEGNKKFLSILSIKDYHEVSGQVLEQFSQLRIDMICTEVFYTIDKSVAQKDLYYQDYILTISGDSKLHQVKLLDEILSSGRFSHDFGKQQLQVLIQADTPEKLSSDIQKAYNCLADLGLRVVHEDIMLEHGFWSQLPGNFSFLKRLHTASIKHIGILSCIHNTPMGNMESKWGEYLTIFKTINNTPYFFNLHNAKGEGHTLIYGAERSGKTSLLNLLLLNATKFKTHILSISTDNSSQAFIQQIGGRYCPDKLLGNPLSVTGKHAAATLLKFFCIICQVDPAVSELAVRQQEILTELVGAILALSQEARKLSQITNIYEFDDSVAAGQLKQCLDIFCNQDSEYYAIFDHRPIADFSESSIIGLNLRYLTDDYYASKHYPKNSKQLHQYTQQLSTHRRLRAAYIHTVIQSFINIPNDEPKILAVDGLFELLDSDSAIFAKAAYQLNKHNGLLLATSCPGDEGVFADNWRYWQSLIATKLVIPHNNNDIGLASLLKMPELNNLEMNNQPLSYRRILMRQDHTSLKLIVHLEGLSSNIRLILAGDKYPPSGMSTVGYKNHLRSTRMIARHIILFLGVWLGWQEYADAAFCEGAIEKWNSCAKYRMRSDITEGAPYNRMIPREGCLKQFNIPLDNSPSGQFKICAETSPDSSFFVPSIVIRSQHVTNNVFNTDKLELSGHGTCNFIAPFGLRICARYTAYINGQNENGSDPGYGTTYLIDEGVPQADSTLNYTVDGTTYEYHPLKLCAYIDPPLYDIGTSNMAGEIALQTLKKTGSALLNAGVRLLTLFIVDPADTLWSPYMDWAIDIPTAYATAIITMPFASFIFGDSFDSDMYHQPVHGGQGLNSLIESIVKIISALEVTAEIVGQIISYMLADSVKANSYPANGSDGKQVTGMMDQIIGPVVQFIARYTASALVSFGRLNKITLDMWEWEVKDNTVTIYDGRGPIYNQKANDPKVDNHSSIGRSKQSIGCVLIPNGPLPPSYPMTMQRIIDPSLSAYAICPTDPSTGRVLPPTYTRSCVRSDKANNFIKNAVRVGRNNYMRQCQSGEDPSKNSCVTFSSGKGSQKLSTRDVHYSTTTWPYYDLIPSCLYKPSQPCVQVGLCDTKSSTYNSKYDDLCKKGFRAVYGTLMDSTVSNLTPYYFEGTGTNGDNNCETTNNRAGCQILWGINIGAYQDIELDTSNAGAQDSYMIAGGEINNPESSINATYKAKVVITPDDPTSATSDATASKKICTYQIDDSSDLTQKDTDQQINCLDRPAHPVPIVSTNTSVVSTHLNPQISASIYIPANPDITGSPDYKISSEGGIVTGAAWQGIKLGGKLFRLYVTDNWHSPPPFSISALSPIKDLLMGIYKDNALPYGADPASNSTPTSLSDLVYNPNAIYINGLEYRNGEYWRGGSKLCINTNDVVTGSCPKNSTQCVLTKTSSNTSSQQDPANRIFPAVTASGIIASGAYYDPVDNFTEIANSLCPVPTEVITKYNNPKPCDEIDRQCLQTAGADLIQPASSSCPYPFLITKPCQSDPNSDRNCYLYNLTVLGNFAVRSKTSVELGVCVDVPEPVGCIAEEKNHVLWPDQKGLSIATGQCVSGYQQMDSRVPLQRICSFNSQNVIEYEPIAQGDERRCVQPICKAEEKNHVLWPDTKAQTTPAIGTCAQDYVPADGAVLTRTCSIGDDDIARFEELSENDNRRCTQYCKSETTNNILWPRTEVSTTATGQCTSGSPASTATLQRRCIFDGQNAVFEPIDSSEQCVNPSSN